jgi:seryl-tRNA(Sec) selenium transferase
LRRQNLGPQAGLSRQKSLIERISKNHLQRALRCGKTHSPPSATLRLYRVAGYNEVIPTLRAFTRPMMKSAPQAKQFYQAQAALGREFS